MKSVVLLSPWSFIIATWTHKCPPWSNLKHCRCWWLNIWLTSWAQQCNYPNFSRWTWLKCHPSYIFPNIAGWCFPVIRRFPKQPFLGPVLGPSPARRLVSVPSLAPQHGQHASWPWFLQPTRGPPPGGYLEEEVVETGNPPFLLEDFLFLLCQILGYFDILMVGDVPTTKPPILIENPPKTCKEPLSFASCKLEKGFGRHSCSSIKMSHSEILMSGVSFLCGGI